MQENRKYKFAIAGAGFSGAVLARELVEHLQCHVVVFEERDHIGGNCHTSRDNETNVMVHRYGPHIFNTNLEEVWNYVNRFAKMGTYVHQVKAKTSKGIFSLPLNLSTINEVFGSNFNPTEAASFLKNEIESNIENPQNFEEVALTSVGKKIYELLIRDYTIKQWGVHPRELPSEVVKRLPVRFNYNSNYHKSKYTGIPENGYSALIENILNHQNIEIKLNTRIEKGQEREFDHLFYCGPIDKFYDYKFGELGYRTVYWDNFIVDGDFQGISQVNYTEIEPKYTRIIEHKHFTPWENHEKSFCSIEFSKETSKSDIPYYPKRLNEDLKKFESYREYAINNETKISFLGRLATYRYLDMDKTISEALNFSKLFMNSLNKNERPVFPIT